jgi:CRP-like cAMP-binding protein
MEIRIATTPEEMERVYRLRYQCYVEELGWKYDQADANAKELRDPLDTAGTIYYAEDGGRMVATYCLHFAGGFEIPEKWRKHYALDCFAGFPESSFSFSSRLMVVPEFRGSTVVPRMLMKAYEEGWKRGTRFNFCFCRPRLIELYERLGFIRYKDNILEPAQGYMVPMILLNEDAAHLKAVHSPFYRICRANSPSQETAAWFDEQFPGMRASATKQMLAPEDFWTEWSEAMSSENVTLLRGLTQEHLKVLLAAGTVLKCRAGDTLLREDEAGHEMFLIMDGMARFSRIKDNGGESQIGLASKGEVFGEIALVTKTKRNATVIAVTDMQVLVISQEFLHRAMKSMPEIAMKLLYNLSHVLGQKLQSTTQQWQGTVREMEKLAVVAAGRGKLIAAEISGRHTPSAGQERTVVMKIG